MSGQKPRLRELRGTALGRMIDLRYRSNRLAVAASVVAGAATLILGATVGDGSDLIEAARVGVGTFLSWAITRELGPDHPTAAALAMAPAALLAIVAPPAAGFLVVALIAVRVWAGTVGSHPTLIDLCAVVAIAAYAGSSAEMWIPAAVLAAGIVAHSPHRVPAAITAALMAAAAATVALVVETTVEPDLSATEVVVIAASAIVLSIVLPIRRIDSVTDVRDLPISPSRVSSAWIGAAASVLGAALFTDVTVAAPLLAAGGVAAVIIRLDARPG